MLQNSVSGRGLFVMSKTISQISLSAALILRPGGPAWVVMGVRMSCAPQLKVTWTLLKPRFRSTYVRMCRTL